MSCEEGDRSNPSRFVACLCGDLSPVDRIMVVSASGIGVDGAIVNRRGRARYKI